MAELGKWIFQGCDLFAESPSGPRSSPSSTRATSAARLNIADGHPCVVPLNFAAEVVGDEVTICLHRASSNERPAPSPETRGRPSRWAATTSLSSTPNPGALALPLSLRLRRNPAPPQLLTLRARMGERGKRPQGRRVARGN